METSSWELLPVVLVSAQRRVPFRLGRPGTEYLVAIAALLMCGCHPVQSFRTVSSLTRSNQQSVAHASLPDTTSPAVALEPNKRRAAQLLKINTADPNLVLCAYEGETPPETIEAVTPTPEGWLLGVDSQANPAGCEPLWSNARPVPFQMFWQGEYVGPHRTPHVPEYRLRVGDQLELVFRKTVEPTVTPYRLNVGDQIRIQSYTDPNLDTTVTIQPDGMITLRLLHQVRAEGRTIDELEQVLEKLYQRYYKKPTITVTPIQLETKLNELRASVDSRFGFGGQGRRAVVSPDGTIQLPALGSVPAQGLTVDELKREIDERYRHIVHGMEVTPVLAQIAPRFVYVLGEVPRPGRYDLAGPTTVMQALSMAGGWQIGGNLRQIVIFRRTDDWRLVATRVDLRGALYGKRPIPSDELWVRDSDVIVVPKSPVQVADDIINLVFTQGIYRVLPNPSISVSFFRNSIL